MSWFQTAVIFNQTLTNIQLERANQAIDHLSNVYQQEVDKRAKENSAREVLFNVKKALSELENGTSREYTYYQLLCYFRTLKRFGISDQAFSSFEEKEYASSIFDAMHQLAAKLESEVSSQHLNDLQLAVRLNYAIPHFAEYANWKDILARMPRRPWFYKHLTPVILSFLCPLHFVIPCYIIFGEGNTDAPLMFLMILQIFYFIGAVAFYKMKKRRCLREIKVIARKYGGWATDKLCIEDCLNIVAQQENAIRQLGFAISAQSTPFEVYKEKREEMQKLISYYHLPLQLNFAE